MAKNDIIQNQNQSISTYGYTGKEVDAVYIVTVISRKLGATIKFILQDKITLNMSSDWEPFLGDLLAQQKALQDMLNIATQGLTGGAGSLTNSMTTRRQWAGTRPLSMTLDLKLVAEFDPRTEVTKPIEMLLAMQSPSKTVGGFLAPPGPSPWQFKGDAFLDIGKNTDIISIYVGNFLVFQNVIIKQVQATVKDRFGQDGLPKAADVSVTFETYETLTKDAVASTFEATVASQGETR